MLGLGRVVKIGARTGKRLGKVVLDTAKDVGDEVRDEVLDVADEVVGDAGGILDDLRGKIKGRDRVSGEDVERMMSVFEGYIVMLEERIEDLEKKEKRNRKTRQAVKVLVQSRGRQTDDLR